MAKLASYVRRGHDGSRRYTPAQILAAARFKAPPRTDGSRGQAALLTYNSAEVLLPALESALKTCSIVGVVDSGSDDRTLELAWALRESNVSIVPVAEADQFIDASDNVVDISCLRSISERPHSYASQASRSSGVDGPRLGVFPHSLYHLIEFEGALPILAQQGVQVVAIIAEDAPPALLARLEWIGLPTIPCAPGIELDALVVQNDWRSDVQALAADIRRRIPDFVLISKVEGIQDFEDLDTGTARNAYRSSDAVLCLGPHDATMLSASHDAIVGSTRLEAIALADLPLLSGRPSYVVNLNFTYGVQDRCAEGWIRDVLRAAARADVSVAVSAHPAQPVLRRQLPITDLPASLALRDSYGLITRFSTLIFEALALGIQSDYFNPHRERAGGFLADHCQVNHHSGWKQLSESIRDRRPTRRPMDDRIQDLAPFISLDKERPAAGRLAAKLMELMG